MWVVRLGTKDMRGDVNSALFHLLPPVVETNLGAGNRGSVSDAGAVISNQALSSRPLCQLE